MNQNGLAHKISYLSIIIVFCFGPYALWAGLLFSDFKIADKNGFLILLMMTLIMGTFFSFPHWKKVWKNTSLMYVFFASMFAFILAKFLFYQIPPIQIINERAILMMPLYMFALYPFIRNRETQNHWLNWFVALALLQVILAIIHYRYFSYIIPVENPDGTTTIEIMDDKTIRYREAGTFMNSNAFGAFCVIALFVTLYNATVWKSVLKRNAFMIISLIFLFGAYISGSRLSFVFGLSVYGLYFMRAHPAKLLFVMPAVLAIAGNMFLNSNFAERFAGDDDSRMQKNILAAEIVGSKLEHTLLGAPPEIVANTQNREGFGVSDNSFTLLATSHGLVVTLIYLAIILLVVHRNLPRNMFGYYYAFYLLIVFFLNNSIIWDNWLLYAGGALFLMRNPYTYYEAKEEKPLITKG